MSYRVMTPVFPLFLLPFVASCSCSIGKIKAPISRGFKLEEKAGETVANYQHNTEDTDFQNEINAKHCWENAAFAAKYANHANNNEPS